MPRRNARPDFQKSPNPKIFTPLPARTYAVSQQNKSPEFRAKAQVRLNIEGACCSRPERNAAVNMKTSATRSVASASFSARLCRASPARRGVYKCKHLKKQSQFEWTL